ncbi:MAG: EamA family transporter [Chlamydiales bacterium]|nr:EamA family transporter [Chlamydiales bacterium]
MLCKNTLKGITALALWSACALFTTLMENIPTYEIMTAAFACSFLVTIIRIRRSKETESAFRCDWKLIAVALVCLLCNENSYLLAFKHAPPAHVDLINYLWPIFFLGLAGMFGRQKVTVQQAIAAVVCFYGIYVLFSGEDSSFSSEYLFGYSCAFIAAVSWAFYSFYSSKKQEGSPNIMGLCCAPLTIVCGVMHLTTETFVMPTLTEFFSMIALGGGVMGLSYNLWENGIKHGNSSILSVFAYFTPIASIALLVLFGFSEATTALLLSLLLIVTGSLLSSVQIPWGRLLSPLRDALAKRLSLGQIPDAYMLARLYDWK